MSNRLFKVVGAPVAVDGVRRGRGTEFVADPDAVADLVASGHLRDVGAPPAPQSEVYVFEDDDLDEED